MGCILRYDEQLVRGKRKKKRKRFFRNFIHQFLITFLIFLVRLKIVYYYSTVLWKKENLIFTSILRRGIDSSILR